MALIKCSECGATASTSAKICPGCGAGAKAMKARPSVWTTTKGGKAVLGLTGVLLVGAVAMISTNPPAAQPETPVDPAESLRNRAAYNSIAAVKRSLREPGSAVFENVRVDDKAKTVCIAYRARNGFGGMGLGHIVFSDGVPSERRTDWNRKCAHKEMYELKDISGLVT